MESDEQHGVSHDAVESNEENAFIDKPATSDENVEENEKPIDGEADERENQTRDEFRRASSNQLESSEFSLLVLLQPQNVRHRVTVTTETTVNELRNMLCTDLKLDAELVSFPNLKLSHDRDENATDLPLSAYGLLEQHGDCVLEAYVARSSSLNSYVMPTCIQVEVYDEKTGDRTTFDVKIEKFSGHKPYLGGFRHSKTQQLYHHASSQTIQSRARRNIGPIRFHRDTQTQRLVTRSLQTHRESGTQMARRDLILDESYDRHVTAKPYFDSYQLSQVREHSVLLLQRLWRGVRARLYVNHMRALRHHMREVADFKAQEKKNSEDNRQRRELSRRMNPKTVRDFEVLYNELDKWRQVESSKIHEQKELKASERQRELDALLAKETKLLQTIDHLKLTATETNRKHHIETMLHFMARPKRWQMSDGDVKEVETPFTVRAKELMALYRGLRLPLTSLDERLDMLLHVKLSVQEFDCPLTRELIGLIDREADMLSRGRKEKSLEGLRKRLTNLFLQFIETPEFNPEAAALKHARN